MAFPDEGPAVDHKLFQTVILQVVSISQDRTFSVLGLGARCWVKKAMPVHPSGYDGFDGCNLEEVYGLPSNQEVYCHVLMYFSKSDILLQIHLTLRYCL